MLSLCRKTSRTVPKPATDKPPPTIGVYMVQGESMSPMIRQGDLIVIRRDCFRLARPGRIAVWRSNEGQYVIHRILDVKPSGFCAKGDQAGDEDTPWALSQFVGCVIARVRNGQVVRLNSCLHNWLGCVFAWVERKRLEMTTPVQHGLRWASRYAWGRALLSRVRRWLVHLMDSCVFN